MLVEQSLGCGHLLIFLVLTLLLCLCIAPPEATQLRAVYLRALIVKVDLEGLYGLLDEVSRRCGRRILFEHILTANAHALVVQVECLMRAFHHGYQVVLSVGI